MNFTEKRANKPSSLPFDNTKYNEESGQRGTIMKEKIFDAHVHANNFVATPKELLSNLDKAGVYGCCVFSNMPKEDNSKLGTSFEERLNEVLNWQKGYEDRIFPVLWIHPYEENAIEKVKIAVDKGICAFKINLTIYSRHAPRCRSERAFLKENRISLTSYSILIYYT